MVSVASAVTGHGWTIGHAWLDAAHQVDTRDTAQQALGIFITYLKMLTKWTTLLRLLLAVPASVSIAAKCRVRFLPCAGRPLLPISSLVFLAAFEGLMCLGSLASDLSVFSVVPLCSNAFKLFTHSFSFSIFVLLSVGFFFVLLIVICWLLHVPQHHLFFILL